MGKSLTQLSCTIPQYRAQHHAANIYIDTHKIQLPRAGFKILLLSKLHTLKQRKGIKYVYLIPSSNDT